MDEETRAELDSVYMQLAIQDAKMSSLERRIDYLETDTESVNEGSEELPSE